MRLTRFEWLLLGSLVFLNALYLVGISSQWHHAVTVTLIVFAGFIVISQPNSRFPKAFFALILLAVPIVVRTILLMDLQGALYVGSYVGTALALVLIGNRYARLSTAILILFLFVGILPITLISSIRGPIQQDDPDSPSVEVDPNLVPDAQSEWRINIGPYGSTFHYTSDLGVVLFAIALVGLHNRGRAYYPLLGLSLYFLVFSGARAGLVTAAAVALLFFVNRRARRPFWTYSILLATVVMVYSANSLVEQLPKRDRTTGGLLPLERTPTGDATSNRSWLWDYHLRLFSENPIEGAGLDAIRFRHHAIIEGRMAPAGSESYYTGLLASFGITGVSIILMHLYLFARTVRHPDLLKLLFGAILIVETVVNSMFATMYTAVPLFVVAYICAGLDADKMRHKVKRLVTDFGRQKAFAQRPLLARPASGKV